MTNSQIIKLATAGVAVAGTVLAVGSTLTGIPGLPGWLVNSWPIVYGVAITFDRVAHVLYPDLQISQPNTNIPPK